MVEENCWFHVKGDGEMRISDTGDPSFDDFPLDYTHCSVNEIKRCTRDIERIITHETVWKEGSA